MKNSTLLLLSLLSFLCTNAQEIAAEFTAPFLYLDSNHTSYLHEETRDLNADGNLNAIYAYTYDANGNITSYTYDSNVDGIPDIIYSYTYDMFGNQTSETFDSDADGTPDRITTYTYKHLKNCNTISGLSNKHYKVNIPEAGDWIFSTCNNTTNFDTRIYVGTTPCNQNLGDNSNFCTDNKAELTLSFSEAQDVYVIVSSENGETGTYELEVREKNTTAINEIANATLSIYPNPTQNYIYINQSDLVNSDYVIYSSLGAVCKAGSLNASTKVNVQELSKGIYTINILDENTNYNAKFIVK